MKDPLDPYKFDYDVDDGESFGYDPTTNPFHFSDRIYHYHAFGLVRLSPHYARSSDEP